MEARGLKGAGAPAFAPIARWLGATDPRVRGELDLATLNALARERALRTESGRPLRFVAAEAAPRGRYECIVDATGLVPTRIRGTGMLHDWCNALAWFAFPRTKARLNALHAQALAADAAGRAPGTRDAQRARAPSGRGRVRDVATLLDESGAAFVCRDQRLREAFVERDWQRLFVRERPAFAREVRVVVFGHALFEKLLDPFKAICAQTIVLPTSVQPQPQPQPQRLGDVVADRAEAGDDPSDAFTAALDAALAERLRAVGVPAPAGVTLHPLPLLGVPGWCEANADPAWYDDAAVFRRGRRRAPGLFTG
ncbi:MAG TPA: DUF3025 domain-containing protein [Zeimonas sp.]|nr:DUF3025 domain-containing protein [Zeimonas sp.]